MLRNEIAKVTGVDPETIRYYENENLISKPKRFDNGYRFYSNQNLTELKFIQHCRSLGISVDEVRALKAMTTSSIDCSEANEIVKKNLALIEQKIDDLKSLRLQLKALSESCCETSAPKDCAIVKSLESAVSGNSCVCHN